MASGNREITRPITATRRQSDSNTSRNHQAAAPWRTACQQQHLVFLHCTRSLAGLLQTSNGYKDFSRSADLTAQWRLDLLPQRALASRRGLGNNLRTQRCYTSSVKSPDTTGRLTLLVYWQCCAASYEPHSHYIRPEGSITDTRQLSFCSS